MRSSLCSPDGSIRLACLRMLLQNFDSFEYSLVYFKFYYEMEFMESVKELFAILIEVEECPADFNNYRQRAQLLRRLKFTSFEKIFSDTTNNIKELGNGTNIAMLVLDWLFAQFYERFTLYWPLLIEPIESYARGIGFDGFWNCFENAMNFCWEMIFEIKKEKEGDSTCDNESNQQLPPDFKAFRLQLLRLLIKLPINTIKPEKRTNYLSPKFLRLYREEFVQVDEFVNTSKIEEEKEESKTDTNNDDQEKEYLRPLNFNSKTEAIKPLKAMLFLFGKFNNPKQIYKEEEIKEMYYELLLVNESEIQRLALGCLYCYKYNWLTPYRASLERLLNEKSFREQLVLFSVDSQQTEALSSEQHGRTVGKNSSNTVPLLEEHRKDFIPILLRILYGSLHTHVPQRGKARRIAIFRFLANCLSDELQLFLQLIILGSLTDIFIFLGPSLNDFQTNFLLNILLLSGKIILLRDQMFCENNLTEEETMPLIRQLKNLRLLFMETITKFLQTFETRIIFVTSIETFFNEILTPLIENKGKVVASQQKFLILLPSSLIKLFCFWIKIRRYQPLLNVPLSIQSTTNLERYAIEKTTITTPFSLLCDQLLIFNKEDVNRIKNVHVEIVQACITFGAGLILSKSNVSKILQHLSHFIGGDHSKIARLPPIYFEFINKLSSLIHDPEFGQLFAQTLLLYITNKNGKVLRRQSVDKVYNLLSTFTRLCVYLENPLIAIRLISPLFSILNGRQAREHLVGICSALCSNKQMIQEACYLLKLIESLESWDARRISEPDADRRCEALLCLHDLYERCDRDKLLVNGAHEFLPLFAHSHAYAMINSSDISLRGTASNCFRQLIIFASKQPNNLENSDSFNPCHFLHSHLIPLVIKGIQSGNDEKMEPVRQEFFQCLIQLMRSFPMDSHLTALREISGDSMIVDDSDAKDHEMDFFEWALHIQTHKRKQAFNQLAKRLNNDELKISHLPLIQYILPIIEPYFLENAPNRVALAEQALNLFTAILKRVPWHKYVKILIKYMNQINIEERTKQAVRLVIATLDAFHFDLRDLKQHLDSTSTIAVTEETLDQKKSKNSKQQIFAFVNGKILPKLRELLRPKTQFNSHKRAQNFTSNIFQYEDEKLLRAPLVLATARLFKWLPQRVVDQNMNGLVNLYYLGKLVLFDSKESDGSWSCLLTLNHLLMSRSISVRQGARKLMINLVKIVGPLQFPHIIRELKQTMNKGYQIHVMIFTVHALINAIAEDLKPGDLDSCLRELLEICKWEAFGNDQFEESFNKDGQTQQLRSESHGVPEAKTSNNKTAETLTQIGRFIGSEKALNEIVLEHIREIVEASPKAETIRKLSEWLRALSAGLRINAGGILPLQQLNFSLNLARKSMRHMEEDKQRLNNSQHFAADKISLRPPNCLLLPTEPKRLGVIHRIAIKSKMHIFVEFAFQILVDQLKGRSENTPVLNDNPTQAKEFIPLLEQFIPLLLEALKKKYDKITALSLRSIFYLFKWPLESLNSRLSELFDLLFVILNDYASLGQSGNRPTIIELHLKLFKCFTHLLRSSPIISSLNTDRLQLLLNYITNIIEYLSEKAITSLSTNIRSQCRQTILLYLINHPQGMRNYEYWMEFFLNQTEYEIVDGRLSALEVVNSILSEFTEEANDRYAMLVFLKLAARLQNEDNEQCLQFIIICLRKLFTSINESLFIDLHSAATDWLSARKPSIRILAGRLFTQFVLSNSSHFTKHLLLKIVRKTFEEFCIEPSKFSSSDVSLDCKLSFCELLNAIAENNPEELFNGIFEFDDQLDETTKEERREFWNDTLADLAIRLLTHFMLALDIPKQFEILCRRLSRICWIEAVKETGKTKKRLCIFKMIGVLVLKCDANSERFGHLVNNFLPLVYREMSDSLRISEEKNKNEDLQILASEVGNLFRKQLGDREYSTQLAKCQREKDERKQKRREQAKV
uniref:Uncharacterized protein n=1 Tax=Meloidogyne javanica TaxID=6303 RepID=A0A915MTL2_MELJA